MCVVPEENLLPNVTGLADPSAASTWRASASPGARMGAAEFCWHRARQYVLDRKQFGRPLAANQLVQKKLADMQTEITLGLHAACGSGGCWKRAARAAGGVAAQAQQLRQGARDRAAARATCTAATASQTSFT